MSFNYKCSPAQSTHRCPVSGLRNSSRVVWSQKKERVFGKDNVTCHRKQGQERVGKGTPISKGSLSPPLLSSPLCASSSFLLFSLHIGFCFSSGKHGGQHALRITVLKSKKYEFSYWVLEKEFPKMDSVIEERIYLVFVSGSWLRDSKTIGIFWVVSAFVMLMKWLVAGTQVASGWKLVIRKTRQVPRGLEPSATGPPGRG